MLIGILGGMGHGDYGKGIGNLVKWMFSSKTYQCIINVQERAIGCHFSMVFDHEWHCKCTGLVTTGILHWIKALWLLNMTWVSCGQPRLSIYKIRFIIFYSHLLNICLNLYSLAMVNNSMLLLSIQDSNYKSSIGIVLFCSSASITH